MLGCVASFTPKKNLHVLLDAFATISASDPTARLVLIGDGPERSALEGLAAEAPNPSAVHFTGRDYVQALLPALDAFVLPSIHEGLGLAQLEALAAGVPCVASAVGGMPEVLGDGVGVLVDPLRPAELREALQALRADDTRRRKLAEGGQDAAQRFDIDATVSRTCNSSTWR